jgi:hypothetical protein
MCSLFIYLFLKQLPIAWDEVASPVTGTTQTRKAAKPCQEGDVSDDLNEEDAKEVNQSKKQKKTM